MTDAIVKYINNGNVCNCLRHFELFRYIVIFSDSFRTVLQTLLLVEMQLKGASIMFGDTIIYNAQRQITLNLKQRPGKHKILRRF